jgi:hypothetical protein
VSTAPATVPEARSRGRALLLAGVGCLHALLFLLSYYLLTSTPRVTAPDEEIVAFYESGNQRQIVLVGLYVMPFAGITFVWFSTTLRVWIGHSAQRELELLSGIQLVSGILYTALFFAAAAAFSVTAVSVQFSRTGVDPALAREFPIYGVTLLVAFAMRMAAMFVFTSSRLGRMTGVIPRWFAHLGLVVGLFLLLSASTSRALVLVFPFWLLALCVLLVLRAFR